MAIYLLNHKHGCGCEEIEADSAEQAIAIHRSQLTEREADYEMYATLVESEAQPVAYQFVEESDGQIYRQELSWTNGEGFTGRHNPENVDFVPKGAAKLHLISLEWEPVTDGEIVIEAFIAGLT